MNMQSGADTTQRWRAAHGAGEALAPLVEINAQCIELLCAMALQPAAQLPPLLARQPEAWRGLSAGARGQLAAVPWLLADAGFSDEARWQLFEQCATRTLPDALLEPAFRGEGARDFIRRVLMFSWHLARAQPQLARLSFGMSPACAARFATLRLVDLDRIADQLPGWVRPRWEQTPSIWRHLLRAAIEEDDRLIFRASLQGIQLLAAGCLPPAVAARASGAQPARL